MAYPRRPSFQIDCLHCLSGPASLLGSYYYIAPVILSIYLLLLNFNIQYYIVCGWFWFDKKKRLCRFEISFDQKIEK